MIVGIRRNSMLFQRFPQPQFFVAVLAINSTPHTVKNRVFLSKDVSPQLSREHA